MKLFSSHAKRKRRLKKCPLCGRNEIIDKSGVPSSPRGCGGGVGNGHPSSSSSSSSSATTTSSSPTTATSSADPTLMTAQQVMLGGKRSPTEICLACCKSVWPTSFLVRTTLSMDDASFIKLAHNLAAIGMDYCTPGLRAHVLAGQSHFKRILASGGGFDSPRQVTEFTWFLLARSADKNCFLTSGSWQLEDPNYRLFTALAAQGYSRVLGRAKALGASEAKAFGSSHLFDFLQHSRARGSWMVPEEHVEYHLAKKGQKGQGYDQVGIDIPKPKSIKQVDDISLFAGKRHVLVGKVPPKHRHQTTRYTFLKLEWHGTRNAGDAIGHVFDFIKTRKGKGKKAENQRKEHADKEVVSSFVDLVKSALAAPTPCGRCLLDSPLAMAEIKLRAKILGLSFMHEIATCILAQSLSVVEQVVQNIHERYVRTSASLPAGDAEQCRVERAGLITRLGSIRDAAGAFLAEINSDPSLDHLDVRFGHEVIFGSEELVAADHLPGEAELAAQMGVFQLAKIITEAVCRSDSADEITLDQLHTFFLTVNTAYGREESSAIAHSRKTMELIGDGNTAPAAQFKLFLLQRFAAYPEQFRDLARVVAPGVPLPNLTVEAMVTNPARAAARRTPDQSSMRPHRRAPSPALSSSFSSSTMGKYARQSTKTKPKRPAPAPSFEKDVKELAGLVSSKTRGYVTLGELSKFCSCCVRHEPYLSDGLKGNARAIMKRIGNNKRSTTQNFASWLSAFFRDLFAADPAKWNQLHAALIKSLAAAAVSSKTRCRASRHRPSQLRAAHPQRGVRREDHPYWYYLDDHNNKQGPYAKEHMSNWISQGHLGPIRMVCGVSSSDRPPGAYVQLDSVPSFAALL